MVKYTLCTKAHMERRAKHEENVKRYEESYQTHHTNIGTKIQQTRACTSTHLIPQHRAADDVLELVDLLADLIGQNHARHTAANRRTQWLVRNKPAHLQQTPKDIESNRIQQGRMSLLACACACARAVHAYVYALVN